MTTMKRLLVLVSLSASVSSFGVQSSFHHQRSLVVSHQKNENAARSRTRRWYSRNGTDYMDAQFTPSAVPVSNVVDPQDSYLQQETFGATMEMAPADEIEVVCGAELCATADSSMEVEGSSSSSVLAGFMNSYLGPRLLLAAVACLYGTNFPLGAIMDQAMPASAATSARFVLAALALSPFIPKIHKDLVGVSLLAGCFTATGYVAQSVSLVDTSPATVSFLGSAIVIWCPFLEWAVDKTPMGFKERPQTWMAAAMCLLGVGILELCGGDVAAFSSVGLGDGLALMQAVGFGTGLFMTEKMMRKHPDQALPITSVLVATTAFISMLWSLSDGWIGTLPGWESMTLPNLFFDPSLHDVAIAVLWTGLLSTSLNFFLEVFALGKVPSGEASVILATEPLWAAAFASILFGESFGWNDYAGGALIVAACLVNSLQATDVQRFIGGAPTTEGQES
jgi:drug/metabolite transporter (DMT)-like permease